MPLRRRSAAVSESDPVVAARLTRVVGPESGVFQLVPPEEPAGVSAGVSFEAAGSAVPGSSSGERAAGRRALAAFDPGRRAVRALGVLALVVAVVVGFVVWRVRPKAEPVAGDPGAVTMAAVPASSPVAFIVVSVVGRVNRPGLVRLPQGARVADAIEAAGGVLAGTDLGYLNLARKVVDGELIAIGVSPPPAPPGGAGTGAAPGGLVNLNTATVAELDTLPGVGPVLAQRIVDHRNRTGGFKSVEELRKVEGVGDARFEQLKDLVTV
jgi:competence protein ComEA